MSADRLLELLDGVKQVAHGRWRARCPSHNGENTNVLSIGETSDGTVLLKCFRGCTVQEIVQAVGLELSDLFPNIEWQATGKHHVRPRRPDDLAALEWMQREASLPGLRLGIAQNAVRRVASKRHRDPLREYFEALPPWDGTQRIAAALCDAWGVADTVVSRATSGNFFRALAARGTIPASKVDTCFVFEGPQGVLKSTSLEFLGGEFYAEISAPIGSPDFAREIRAVLIAELGELHAMRGHEAQRIKQALSRRYDRYVEKYERNPREYPRRCVFVGTTNDETYWHDSTGARRLVPVRVGDIRLDLIRENKAQWLAEALADVRGGHSWHEWPTGIEDEREERQDVDPWELTLRDLMATGRKTGLDGIGREPWPSGWISSADIMRDWLRLEPHQQGRGAGARIGHVMRRLGYCPREKGHDKIRGWEPNAEIGQNKCPQAEVPA